MKHESPWVINMALTRQQRFARNVVDNIERGLGVRAFRVKGYTFPTHEQMDSFKKYHVPYDVDPAIRDVVIEINDAGYRTAGSCQGHSKGGQGFISVHPHRTEYPTKLLAEKYKPEPVDKIVRGLLSMGESKKPVNPGEIKNILLDNGLEKVRHDAPFTRLLSNDSLKAHHGFTFTAVPGD